MELDRLEKVNLLFDFYSGLLTKRQQKFMRLYYGEDFSLGEIAAEYGVSRQAVHDTLKRAEKTLETYEKRLGLAAKFYKEKTKIIEVLTKLTLCEQAVKADDKETTHEMKRLLYEARRILEEILNFI